MYYKDREYRRRQDIESRIGRRVDIFIDHWILYRDKEPKVPVLRDNQDEFRTALIEMMVESEEWVLGVTREANERRIARLLKPSGEV